MSNPPLPPELLDSVVDFLHDSHRSLRVCSLVSKSWIPRARKHLFANVEFTYQRTLRSWKATFPDPAASPAHYTKTLRIRYPHCVALADAKEGCTCLISTFSRVVDFAIEISTGYSRVPETSLVPFYAFSLVLKSLDACLPHIPHSRVFIFILSFPLLEDLSLNLSISPTDDLDWQPATIQSSTSPPFTGSFNLILSGGMNPLVHHLLSLPGGLHFRKLHLRWWHGEDPSSTAALVQMCSPTLESLHIDCGPGAPPSPSSVDLSKATKLTDLRFSSGLDPQWVTFTLRTITGNHRNLREVTPSPDIFNMPDIRYIKDRNPDGTLIHTAYTKWLELDDLLVRPWESHSIRLCAILSHLRTVGPWTCMDNLFPATARAGVAHVFRKTGIMNDEPILMFNPDK